MAEFRKTIGGKDPWGMPSDGSDMVATSAHTRKWERRQYHRAARREARSGIDNELRGLVRGDLYGWLLGHPGASSDTGGKCRG